MIIKSNFIVILHEMEDATNKEELEEQTKLVNSFLKLAYWY